VFKIQRGRRLIAQSVGVAVAGGGLALAVAATGVALTQYPVVLHQTPPITAAGFHGGTGTDCGNASNQDGWFFVLPANTTDFSTLDITFSNGTIVSGPTFLHGGKQATIVTTAGAILESGSGQVTTTTGVAPAKNWFNLSHTCKAGSSPSPSPSPKPSGSPSGSPSSPPGAPTPTPVSGNLPVTG